MRGLVGAVAYLAGVVGTAYAITVIAPFAPISVPVLACLAVGILTSSVAVFFRRSGPIGNGRTPVWMYIVNIVFFAGGLGAMAGGMGYRMAHEELGVTNGTAAPVEIAIDGHALGQLPAGSQGRFDVPSRGTELVATSGGKVVDRVPFDVEGNGRAIFDVGGTQCFYESTVRYGGGPRINLGFGGPSDGRVKIGIGARHLFRHQSDFLWAADTQIKSKSSEETRTLLSHATCSPDEQR